MSDDTYIHTYIYATKHMHAYMHKQYNAYSDVIYNGFFFFFFPFECTIDDTKYVNKTREII